MKTDYLIVGSGLSGLVFGALMAKSGKKVQILEAHEHPGGFGHTFTMAKKYTFNAQLHYVWDCGEGAIVNRVLKKLNLDKEVTFERYDRLGFDRMKMPGYELKIPSDWEELNRRLANLFPESSEDIARFLLEVKKTRKGLMSLSFPIKPLNLLQNFDAVFCALKYLNSTLQNVFDRFNLPLAAQTLLASQWLDFMLPPDRVSFYAWAILFSGYVEGAFYPTRHYKDVINSLVRVIEENDGEVILNREVTQFLLDRKTVIGVKAIDKTNNKTVEYKAENIICNIDPQKAAKTIGLENFAPNIRRKLNYDYSPSNFMVYCVVKDLDLQKYGFGKWNTFHTGDRDLNKAFDRMYEEGDYSNPSFAMTSPTLMTKERGTCPEDCQIVEFLTVANYDYFQELNRTDKKAYRQKKNEIFDYILDRVEKHYIPNFRKHIVFKITGSPTTNERFCWCPQGNSYGSNLTPRNIGIGRLNHFSSLNNFYFCNASAGYPGFAPTFWTGARLYQILSGDVIISKE